ncbi:hypothetical protein MMC11_000860 [Xylographa trunciseda]|nr:hypothetical protein [Xylographa trunciseda]
MAVAIPSSKFSLQPSLATLPHEIHYHIFEHLAPVEQFCLSLTCRTLFHLYPGIEVIEYYDQWRLLLLWEKDGFFQGLACADCNKFHQTKYFDILDIVTNALSPRSCIGSTGYVNLHPKWSMNFWDFREIIQNLRGHTHDYKVMELDNGRQVMEVMERERRYLNTPDQVTESLEYMEEVAEGEDTEGIHDTEDTDDLDTSHRKGAAYYDIFSSDMLNDAQTFRYHIPKNARVQNFITPQSTFHQRDIKIADIYAWISRVQFYSLSDGAVRAILVWFLNLDCLKFPHSPTLEDMAKELDENGLCVNLCPHVKMNDERVIATYFSGQIAEGRHGKTPSSDSFQCSHCLTRIKVQMRKPRGAVIAPQEYNQRFIRANVSCLAVAVTRNFGKLQSALDPAWLNQLN